jgi:branched-chain amino acid transport system ATP-binding protein
LDLIERLRNEGKTIFLIEHDMEVVMRRCDWIIVLHQGRKLAEGAAADIRKHERVVDAYLGG